MNNIPSKTQSIAEVISHQRQAAGITAKELADRAGLSPAYISRVENGEYQSLSLSTVKSLANGLGLSLRDLLQELGLLNNEERPSFKLITQSLRHMGYSDQEAEDVIRYARYVRQPEEGN